MVNTDLKEQFLRDPIGTLVAYLTFSYAKGRTGTTPSIPVTDLGPKQQFDPREHYQIGKSQVDGVNPTSDRRRGRFGDYK
ncbi:hypothetical protein COY27_06070 [Candidatus Woesearchaeota archaeon CG_4_10_14_0_2_um_filter_33_13]|nr:MAG: hypothetical protein COY27_06070 [Candidatus Woesearchaeota archaeon CG_4_10_14_0_2_um_filter_33_13]